MTSPVSFPVPSAGRAARVRVVAVVVSALVLAIALALCVAVDLDLEGWFIVLLLMALGAWIVWEQVLSPPRRGGRVLVEAQEHYERVESAAETVRADAARIPADDAHGAQVLARYRWYEGRLRGVGEAVAAARRMRWGDWHDPAMREAAAALVDDVAGLGAVGGAVHNAATLLTLAPGWEEAWANECGPLREDLTVFRELCEEIDDGAPLPASQRDWARECSARIAAMRARIASGALTPGAALDELDALSREIRTRADALARRALTGASPDREAGLASYREDIDTWKVPDDGYEYSGTWDGWDDDGGREGASYDPASTIRLHDCSPGVEAAGVRWPGFATVSQYSSPIERVLDAYLGSRSTDEKS